MSEENFAEEFFGLPEYVVGKAIAMPMDLGVRVYHWSKHGSVLLPKFTAVLSAKDLVLIGRSVQNAAMQAIMDAEAMPFLKN